MTNYKSDYNYQIITAVFCIIVIIADIISVKLVSISWVEGVQIPAGAFLYPLTFLLSSLVTELYGPRKAKAMVFIALGMTILSYSILQLALLLPTKDKATQEALQLLLQFNGIVIFASLSAYTISQMMDIFFYAIMKKRTQGRFLWLRCNGAGFISQAMDTIIVNMIHLYWGLGLDMDTLIPTMLFSYLFKVSFTFCLTPLFYIFVFLAKPKANFAEQMNHVSKNNKKELVYEPSL